MALAYPERDLCPGCEHTKGDDDDDDDRSIYLTASIPSMKLDIGFFLFTPTRWMDVKKAMVGLLNIFDL